jgi:DNA-binding transcriptional LysR family regulator
MAKGFEVDALKALGCIVERRSFAAAAREMQVSRSALSEMIRKLEARLGVQLLNRTTRSVSPTEACIALLSRFEPAAAEIDSALVDARLNVGRVSGTIRVHAQRLGYEMILRPAMASFLSENLEVTLDLSLDDATIDIVAGGFDIGIRLGELLDQDVIGIPMGPELRQVAVASPAYLERHGHPTVPKDLLSHRCVTFRWPGRDAVYAWEFRQPDGVWFSVPVSGPLVLNDQRAAIDAALAGIGVAFWVESELRPLIDAGQLVPLLGDWCGGFPGFSLYFPRGRHRSAAVQALIASLRRHFEC